jgi:hypothetical protein
LKILTTEFHGGNTEEHGEGERKMGTELLPCPFCGGRGDFIKETIGGGGTDIYYVRCNSCAYVSPCSENKEFAKLHWNAADNHRKKILTRKGRIVVKVLMILCALGAISTILFVSWKLFLTVILGFLGWIFAQVLNEDDKS